MALLTPEELAQEIVRVCERSTSLSPQTIRVADFLQTDASTQARSAAQHGVWRAAKRLLRGELPPGPGLPQPIEYIHTEEDPIQVSRERRKAAQYKRTASSLTSRVVELEDALENALAIKNAARLQERLRVEPYELTSNLREATAVVLCSDWHVEEHVDPRTVNHRNSYDLAEAEARLDRLFESIMWHLNLSREQFSVRELVLWLGGDLMTGYIHAELVESNNASPIETVLWLRQRIRLLIDRLLASANLTRLLIPCSYGNHGRAHEGRPKISTAAVNNFEWLLYRVLASDYAEDSRVQFQVSDGAELMMDIYGFRYRFHHGDYVKYGGGIGGIHIPLQKKLDRWNATEYADVTCIGHFHTWLAGPGLRYFVNGSLIGYAPFTFKIAPSFEHPMQSWHLVDSRRGPCMPSQLWVTEVK